jgi:CheY-like chemotaxis protein
MKVSQAADGAAAVEAVAGAAPSGDPFRLVLADAHLPDMDGWALAQGMTRLREMNECIVVLMTQYGRASDAHRTGEAGVAAALTKPVRQGELRETLLEAFGDPSQRAALAALSRMTSPQPEEQAGSSLRILLAEDNPVNQRLARKLLERRGHQVSVAGNGREALALFDCQAFDVVLMDVQMPEMDGLEATAAIRIKEERTEGRVPIIALTAHAMKGDEERCLRAGMDGYVTKPVKADTLFDAIDAALLRRPPAAHSARPPGTLA